METADSFNAALWQRFKEGKIRNVYPKAKYDHIIMKIKAMSQEPPVNSPGEYYLLRKFVIATVDGVERLACKDFNSGARNGFVDVDNVKFFVALEEICEFISKAHFNTSHGGRDRIARLLQLQGVMNIARETIELYLSFCDVCRPKHSQLARRLPPRIVKIASQGDNSEDGNNTTDEGITVMEEDPFNFRDITFKSERDGDELMDSPNPEWNFKHGHVAILDITASPDGNYKFILVYLDYDTQFTILRPVKCKCTYEISSHLLDIFTLISPPQILHSDYDSPFLSLVIQEMKQSWQDCVIVVSKDNTQRETAKQCISDVEKVLREWIAENNSHRWSFGLKFIQLKHNLRILPDGQTPFEHFFGRAPVDVPPYLTSSLQHEEDLINIMNKHKNQPELLQVTLDPNICSLVQNNVPEQDECPDEHQPEAQLIIDTSIVKTEPLDMDESSYS